MKLRSQIEFPSFLFRQYDPEGELKITLTASAIYDIVNGEELVPAEEQRPIQMSDEYTIDDGTGQLLRQADFVTFKPATDVTAIAKAWAPEHKPRAYWDVGIGVKSMFETRVKRLRVHGERTWKPTALGGWGLSYPKETDRVDLSYFHAFGGNYLDEEIVGDLPPSNYKYNPIGPGVLKTKSGYTEPFPAPQIESVDDPITSPLGENIPQGFAPIAPYWRFRQQYTGTYDQTWIDTHHPFLPLDFDYKFYNCAHPDLIFDPYLDAGDQIELWNLHEKFPHMVLSLPDIKFGAVASYKNGKAIRSGLDLDGVHFELLDDVPRVRLTWRTQFAWRDGIAFVDLGKLSQEQRAKLFF